MNKIKDFISTNDIAKYIIVLVLVIVVLLGVTLAYYTWGTSVEERTNVTFDVIANVYIEYDGGADITGTSLYPASGKTNGITKEIYVTFNGESAQARFNLYLDLTTFPNELKDQSFKYAVDEVKLVDGTEVTTEVKNGDFTETGVKCETNSTDTNTINHIALLSNVVPDSTVIKYIVYIWIDGENYVNTSSMMNQTFTLTLHADGDYLKEQSTSLTS